MQINTNLFKNSEKKKVNKNLFFFKQTFYQSNKITHSFLIINLFGYVKSFNIFVLFVCTFTQWFEKYFQLNK